MEKPAFHSILLVMTDQVVPVLILVYPIILHFMLMAINAVQEIIPFLDLSKVRPIERQKRPKKKKKVTKAKSTLKKKEQLKILM